MHIVVKPKQITSSQKADHILKKKIIEALDPILPMDAMTRIFAMRSYTPFYKNPKKKTKEGEEKP